MKKILFVLVAVASGIIYTHAQSKINSVAISFPQNLVEYFAQPAAAKSVSLPLIQAKAKNGDLFGINFQGIAGTASFIELLDANSKVVSTVTVGDFLGKSTGKGVNLVSSVTSGSGNRSENVYEVSSAQGKYLLIVNSLTTSAASTKENPAKLLVRFAVRNNPATIASARITLPVDGTAETKNGGFIISGKKSTQPIVAAFYPKTAKISIEKKNITVVTPAIKTANETLLLSLSVDCANTKEEAFSSLLAYDKNTENNIAIVTVSNKATAAPTDTVMYQIICTNIGNGSVSDIVITNPVTAGSRYLEGSAVGEDSQISFDRTPSAAPALGDVKSIKWKLSKTIEVGEEKIVSFKVIVQ